MSRTLNSRGREQVAEIARRHGVSQDAALVLLQALQQSGGGMAQFNHPELGGGGQWMAGGMTMVGDMFNHGLKAKVDGLCSELAALLPTQPQSSGGNFQSQMQSGGSEPLWEDSFAATSFTSEPPGEDPNWPDFGWADWRGGQNDMRYAYYAAAHRLVVSVGGKIVVYDTGTIPLQGVSQQQQNGFSTLVFTTPSGPLPLTALRAVDAAPAATAPPPEATPAPPSGMPGGLPDADELSGTRWTLTPGGVGLTLLADGTISGGDGEQTRYWAVEQGALRLFAADGHLSARFDTARRDPANRLLALTRAGAAEPTLTPAGATKATEPAPPGLLTLTLDLTGGLWALSTDRDGELYRLRLLTDGRIEGGRAGETLWRSSGASLSFLHGSGRPTIRFDSFHCQAGTWMIGGIVLGEENLACTLRQV